MKITVDTAEIWINVREREREGDVLVDIDNPEPAIWLTPESAEEIGHALLDAAKNARKFS